MMMQSRGRPKTNSYSILLANLCDFKIIVSDTDDSHHSSQKYFWAVHILLERELSCVQPSKFLKSVLFSSQKLFEGPKFLLLKSFDLKQ